MAVSMNRLLKGLLLFFLAVNVFTGCREPVGSLSGGNGTNGNGGGSGYIGSGEFDFLWLRPNRILYDVNEGSNGRFERERDLRVFVADDGGFFQLNTSDINLKIEVIMHPGMSSEIVLEANSVFVFTETGRYIIRGTFNGKSDEYSIEVRGSYVNPGDGSGFLDWIWL